MTRSEGNKEPRPITSGGSNLPTKNSCARIGVTRICSIVPLCFSRTMPAAGRIMASMKPAWASIDSAMKRVLVRSGLYQTRTDGRTPPVLAALPAMRC